MYRSARSKRSITTDGIVLEQQHVQEKILFVGFDGFESHRREHAFDGQKVDEVRLAPPAHRVVALIG